MSRDRLIEDKIIKTAKVKCLDGYLDTPTPEGMGFSSYLG